MTHLIIGAGIAGLAAAHELRERGEEFTIIEAAHRVGGVISSLRTEGFLLEKGPRTIAGAAPTLRRLVEAAGLSDECRSSNPASQTRYVFSKGALHPVPHGPGELWRSKLLSFGAKARILAEPLIPRGGQPKESIEDFVSRRFGREASSRLADPMCAGIFGGHPSALGIEAFGRASALEQEHGSILVGMARSIRSRKERGEGVHSLLSFDQGLQQLTDSLATMLGSSLRLGTQVTAIKKYAGGFTVCCQSPAAEGRGSEEFQAERLTLAVPAPVAAQLLQPLSPQLSVELGAIYHAPIAVVALGFAREAIAHPLDGFGLLRCSDSPLPGADPILGILFSSSIFDGRAPEGKVLLEVMMGGARDPNALAAADSELLQRALQATKVLLGSQGEHCFHAITRWQNVLPQYQPGHNQLIQSIERAACELGPLRLAGNYLRGVGVEGAAASGVAAVSQASSSLSSNTVG